MSAACTSADFERILGAGAIGLPAACRELIATADFAYDEPSAERRDEIVLAILRHLESGAATAVGPQRADLWERCWAENLEKFVDARFALEALVPKFIKPDQPVRLGRRYVLPRSPAFELSFFAVCRAFYYQKYFAGVPAVYEFGCGTGFNLVALGQQMPGVRLHGLDWSHSAVEMIELIGKRGKLDISGTRFDFFNPDRALALGAGSGVMTMCALEQVGARHGAFVDFLLEKKPRVCLHMEPIAELYDEGNLADYLALKYHRTRGYLDGFLTRLEALAAEGRIELMEVRRTYFGSLYHEGYTFVVWRPL